MRIVIISGYFNPAHKGHIKYIQAAKKLGDYLIAIVNNDEQVYIKGSQEFMSMGERLYITEHIKGVDRVFPSIDNDRTVCKSIKGLAGLYPLDRLIFAKGGDRTIDNIPEKKICDELGVETVFGVGGAKVQSSSELLKKVK